LASLKDIAVGALFLIGAGYIAKRTEAGKGLAELGGGVYEVAVAPFKSVGMGLGYTAGGIRSIAETFGDIASGIGDILSVIPRATHPPSSGLPYTPSSPSTPSLPREEDRSGVYWVNVAGNGWTFPGAGKIFRSEDRARQKYGELVAL